MPFLSRVCTDVVGALSGTALQALSNMLFVSSDSQGKVVLRKHLVGDLCVV